MISPSSQHCPQIFPLHLGHPRSSASQRERPYTGHILPHSLHPAVLHSQGQHPSLTTHQNLLSCVSFPKSTDVSKMIKSIIQSVILKSAGVLSCSFMSDSVQPHGLQPTRLLCPWNFSGKNTAMGCYFLLQGIFPTQGLNPHLLHQQADSLPTRHPGSPHLKE